MFTLKRVCDPEGHEPKLFPLAFYLLFYALKYFTKNTGK